MPEPTGRPVQSLQRAFDLRDDLADAGGRATRVREAARRIGDQLTDLVTRIGGAPPSAKHVSEGSRR